MIEALKIHVTGIVQGVGFRPFVYRLAKRYLVNGWVLNAADGVTIHAEAESQLLDEFVLAIANDAPAASKVEEIEMTEVPLEDLDTFEIRFSDEAEVEKTTLVSPDLATCDDCVRELFDPADKRYHYPFINCTNCGPRFTIIRQLPYDRAKTSMSAFPMCPDCSREYRDPLNRRFHAQPDACFDCGPTISFAVLRTAKPLDAAAGSGGALAPCADRGTDQSPLGSAAGLSHSPEPASLTSLGEPMALENPSLIGFNPPIDDAKGDARVAWGRTREESDAIIERAAQMLREGGIVAVKGLGGFHLACDAANEQALATLRQRKRREGKAFAVMVRTVEEARAYCHVGAEEANALQSPARPIVLLRKREDVSLARGLADYLPELGVMLPATPVQHLLLAAFGGMLVMTSGNVHDEPIETDDVHAYRALAGVADAFLGNDRPILSRYDDSVVRVITAGSAGETVQVIRRARGFAPLPLPFAEMPEGQRDQVVLATGPEQKNTFCLARDGEAFVSQHVGDMENVATNDAWLQAKATYERVFELPPTIVAADKHPEYLTSKWAASQPLPVTGVQHHHAHIVSAMAENGLEGPVCGIAFDGTGYGEDGAIWGGEVLICNLQAFERFANFAYFPLPGGAAAIRNPLRCAYGALWAFDLLDHPAAARVVQSLGDAAEICEQMIERGLNCPYTSSAGRLFDAASAILGVCTQPAYEGEGAILLEAAMRGVFDAETATVETETDDRYRIDVVKNTATETSTAQDTSVVLMDAAPLFAALLDDVQAGVPASVISRRFHDAFAQAIVAQAQLAEAVYGIRTVVLSGGVFMNRHLVERALAELEQAGFTVAINRDLPPNDGCISYGQAVVARQLM